MKDAPPQQPPTPGPEEGPSEKAVRNVRAAVLQLVETDPEFTRALATALAPAVMALLPPAPAPTPAAAPRIGESDAEHARNVVDLIEQTMTNKLRPDAFRRPVYTR